MNKRNKMTKMNKINLYHIKCQKVTDNSTSIELKPDADTTGLLYCNCLHFGCEKYKV